MYRYKYMSMYMYMYIYVHVYVYIYYIHIHMYTYICIFHCMHTYILANRFSVNRSLDDTDPYSLINFITRRKHGSLVNCPAKMDMQNCKFVNFGQAWKDENGLDLPGRLIYLSTKSVRARFNKKGYATTEWYTHIHAHTHT